MKSGPIISILSCLLILTSFGDLLAQNGSSERGFFTIDYEEVDNNKKSLKLSEIANKVIYIKLETNAQCLIGAEAKYYFSNKYIFVSNKNHVLQFGRDGRFIKQIGFPGRGPGEIGLIRNLSVIEEEELIIIQTNWSRKLLYFSFDGKLLKSTKINDLRKVKAIPQGKKIQYDACLYGPEDYVFTLLGPENDTLDYVINPYKTKKTKKDPRVITYRNFIPFYNYAGQIYFKSMYNDTIYTIRNNQIFPAYSINMGRYKMPDNMRFENAALDIRDYLKNAEKYRYISALQSSGNIFLTVRTFNDQELWHSIFEIGKNTGLTVKHKGSGSSKIVNDIDGGPDFWPVGNFGSNIVFDVVQPYELLEYVKIGEPFSTNKVGNESRSDLMNILSGLKKDDNPVLVLGFLK